MKRNIHYRAWFYFRTGYGQYFTFAFGIVNMLTLTYYLAIEGGGWMASLFPSFLSYVLVCSLVITPTVCAVGYFHMRRSHAFASDLDITTESHPYNYKLPPGIMKECLTPMYQEMFRLLLKSVQKRDEVSDKELDRLKALYQKLDLLDHGNSLPKPKHFDYF